MKFTGNAENGYEVELHKSDTWSADFTLAHVIMPVLIQLKETKHGAPETDNKDVPERLHGFGTGDDGSTDPNWFKRWDYILDEMIWAFSAIIEDDCLFYQETEHWDRVNNGTRLFGKYYRGLWD